MKNQSSKVYHKPIYWQNLHDSATGLAISSLVNTKPLLIITPDFLTSLYLERELKFFPGKEGGNIQILHFPGWETLPYDHFSPSEDVISTRLLVLYKLVFAKSLVVFISASTLMHQLPPKSYITSSSFVVNVGETIDFVCLRRKFEGHGYNLVTKVMEHGEFTVRGSIIDIFPMGSEYPFRIDLLDTVIDSIRIFDVDTQRSVKKIDSIKLLPAHEFSFGDEAIEIFYQNWISYFGSNPLKSPIYQSISSRENYPGIEYYLPLFFKNVATLFDYLSPDSIVIAIDTVEEAMQNFWNEINARYEQLRHDQMHPILPPEDIFIKPKKICELKDNFQQFLINDKSKEKVNNTNINLCFRSKKLETNACDNFKNAGSSLMNILKSIPDAHILFIAESIGHREVMLKVLSEFNISPTFVESWQEFLESTSKILLTVAKIDRPLCVTYKDGLEIVIITEAQIFGGPVVQEQKISDKLPQKIDAIIHNLTELQINDPIVHIDHGIGRYLGLQKLQTGDYENEFFVLEYANYTKLYVPVTSLDLINRYTGIDVEHVSLNHLGTKQWDKTKRKAMLQVRDTAAELLEVYARRQTACGFKFVKPEADYEKFIISFPFIITPDQARAIDEVIADMTTGRLMDRLVCGEVGFGKTEVAMRAAFLAVYNAKQVAILTPTTLLAHQHFINFRDRFVKTPVKIALFSRFLSTQETKKIVEDLSQGKIDIVIGTHKLLQKNVNFKDLGLLIVDEEHRFGVRQKEHIKKLANNIDILTLTATPIPRTLNMAFAGIRDFSVIATPPAKRLAIKTFIREYDPYLIKEAILRETLRDGQVYFLHNDIITIGKMMRELVQLVPGIRIAVAHGQMRKQELEKIMNDFYHLRINVLVCSTIIESGLDIPTANTIIINRADNFGLAQLHQLRGRVGRSYHQAYAYLIIPPRSILSAEAKKRLEAIEAMKDLGSGFTLATNDLEIRGAGELLGEKQNGIIQGIGFTLYMELLQQAVKNLKQHSMSSCGNSLESKTEIELQISTLIPDKYIDNVNLRLVLYKKIAAARDQNELDSLQMEMIDRFGLLPEQTKNLFRITTLKLKAQKLGITKITMSVNKGLIKFTKNCQLDLPKIIHVMQKCSKNYKFIGSDSIEFFYELTNKSRLDFVEQIVSELLISLE
ncbi:MAG: transcription-repair coupling factor [Coxiellaceae bacterium]|jgi:transcription-repair coupling factor (superfamily II helicase)|nr:transcription-repair coupling factor [Coxiellaceae bacterium]